MVSSQYKKSWLATCFIARMLIVSEIGDRIPTIQEYVNLLDASRGVVQNALQTLQEEGAVDFEKRGSKGTVITNINIDILFRLADINFITASMPIPGNYGLAGLASGISYCMNSCPVPFNFAFVQGSGNRIDALKRGVYDFIVVSQPTANHFVAKYPDLEVAAILKKCRYAEPYVFCSRKETTTEPQNGMTMAVDPKSTDQFKITSQLCQNKDIKIITCTYTTSKALFLEGKVDCLVYHKEPWTEERGIWAHPLKSFKESDVRTPVCLTAKTNQSMGKILLNYINESTVSDIQNQVTSKKMEPQFF